MRRAGSEGGGRGSVRLVGLLAILGFAVIVVVWAASQPSPGRSPHDQEAQEGVEIGPEVGARAPNFETVDGEGTPLTLSEYRGSAVLVNFWASWCVACKVEMPAIQSTLHEHRREGFEVIAVNERETAETARRFLDDLGVDFRLALDPDGRIGSAYGVFGLPASFFVDREGVIRHVWLGEMSPEMVEEFTHLTLGQEPASTQAEEPVDLMVLLEPEGPDTLYLLSPAIRCDASYCARELLRAVHIVPAVREARWIPQGEGGGGELPIFVRFDPAVGGPEAIVAAFRESLRRNPDPLYGSELAVRYLQPQG